MDLDYLKNLVDDSVVEAESINETGPAYEKLLAYIDDSIAEGRDAIAEVARLNALINSPQTADFAEAVRIEAAHQVERWGVEHDAGKRPEDWVTLVIYLLGKASKAHFDGNHDKLLHHVITLAAVAMNWHRNMTGENTRMRPGVAP